MSLRLCHLLSFSSTSPLKPIRVQHRFGILLVVLTMLLFQGGCVYEPLSVVDLPCSTASDCELGFCVAGKCATENTQPATCSKDKPCACGTCDEASGSCRAISCTADSECTSCKAGYCDKGACKVGPKPSTSCQSNSDCSSNLCVNNKCFNCREDRDCSSNLCVDGQCKDCASEGDCKNGRLCKDKVCTDCKANDDCPSKLCVDGSCKPCANSDDCKDGRLCKNKVCTKCSVNEDCSTFLCSGGACKPCASSADCGSGECQAGKCSKPCKQNSDCSTNLCSQNRCAPCNKAEDCVESLRCIDNRCASPCQSTADCLTGRICDSGKCRLPQEGETCTSLVGCNEPLTCITEAGSARCRQACDPLSSTNNCPSGQLCAYQPSDSQSINGICKASKNGQKVDQDCSTKHCEVNLFCRADGPKKLCRKFCDTQKSESCGANQVCVALSTQSPQIGVCLPQVCKGSVGNCTMGFQCYQDACRKSCDSSKPATGCDTKEFCFGLGSGTGGICLDKQCGGGESSQAVCNIANFCEDFQCKPVSPKPKTCGTSGNCKSSELCVRTSKSNSPSCRAKCSYRKAGACSSTSIKGHVCTPLPNPVSSSYAICLPKKGGGTLGVNCKTGTLTCERDHFCVPVTSSRSICLPLCSFKISSPRPDDQCPTGFQCKFKVGSSVLGVCVKTDKVLRVGEACGPTLGVCPADHECAFDSKTSKTFCRKTCSSSSGCSSSENCTTTKSAILQTVVKVCTPK